jgi:RNA polymerase sigma factor (sigma-70 family)
MSAADPDVRARALEAFATAYWVPVSRYIRFKWRLDAERAADLTQDFFARTLESQALARFDPDRARFRTYVRVLVDGFVSNARKAEGRLKRGGGVEALPLEEILPDGQVRSHEPPVHDDHDDAFYREWVRALFEGAVDDLRADATARGRDGQFEVFRRYDLADLHGEAQPTYADLAAALGLTVAMVTNHLAAVRRALRARVLDRLREATGSEAEYEAEAKRLLGTRR